MNIGPTLASDADLRDAHGHLSAQASSTVGSFLSSVFSITDVFEIFSKLVFSYGRGRWCLCAYTAWRMENEGKGGGMPL
jgi:hypothetical protein